MTVQDCSPAPRPGVARRLVDLPTRFHLWTAEVELRAATTPGATPEQLMARRRNLDRLRTYRTRREFPRNTYQATPTPCFVDADQRLCAVGYLMDDSGHHAEVRRIAETSNLARIAAMDQAVLAPWATRSGLTTTELARIQPNYGSDWGPRSDAALAAAWALFLLIPLAPLALISILTNAISLSRGFYRRSRATIGVVLGALMVALFLVGTTIALVADEYDEISPLHPALLVLFALPCVVLGLVVRRRIADQLRYLDD